MKQRSLTLAAMFVFVLSLFALPAFAHEGREVGDYQLYFGWRVEPAYVGVLNGPEVFISPLGADEEAGLPEDVVVDLQVEVSFGDETMTLPLEAAWGETGHYVANLIPTLPGDYSFHLTGTIGDTTVDEVFTSADGQFGTIEPASDIMFPRAGITDVSALQARIDELEARVVALEAK